jgi:hypothetical protein
LVNSAIISSGTNTSGAGIVSAIPPYTGVPITSGNAVLIYRDTLTVAGSTNFYKIQKYQRA